MIAWWQLGSLANALISGAFFVIFTLIMKPLVRRGQVRANLLAVCAAAVFFCAGVGRAIQALVPLLGMTTAGSSTLIGHNQPGWQLAWDVMTAAAALGYLAMRRVHADHLVSAALFDDMSYREHVARLELLQAEGVARAAAEAERDSYAGMLRAIIDNDWAATYVKDLEGRYLMANRRLAAMLEMSEEELLGKTNAVINPRRLPAQWQVNEARAQVESYTLEEWNDAFADGRHFYESVKFPLKDADGVVYATAGMKLDVTTQRRATQELAEARDAALTAAEAKATFLANMSHEIRTPMNAVIGMTDLLTDTELTAEQSEFLDTIRSSGDALMSVINDILDYSKIDSGAMELEAAPFDIRDEVERCLDMVTAAATAKGLELIGHVDETCPGIVIGDVVRTRQIVANLLTNAVKFTEHGEVLLTVSSTPVADNKLETRITVTDTGVGISRSGMERLFRSFSQVNASTTRVYGGTGLGLAISQRLAEAMGGGIEVHSHPGVGSSFVATMMLDPCLHTTYDQDPDGFAAPQLRGKRILIVDDNPTNLRILDLQLTGLGMLCTQARSAAAALDLMADGLAYDIAVLDMHMPHMDGMALGERLRDFDGSPSTGSPLVLFTSLGSRPPHLEDHFAAFLTKPVKRSGLREALISALTGQRLDHERSLGISATPPLRVLLAEDNIVNQRVAQLILSKLGQLADIVADGVEAARAVQAKDYDLVLMDVQMPIMDGLEATRRIRSHPSLKQPHITAITASALLEDREACEQAGMNSYLSKPVRVHDLQQLLASVSADLMDLEAAGPALGLDEPTRAAAHASPAVEPAHTAPAPVQVGLGDAASPIDVAALDALMTELEDSDGALRASLIDSYLADGKDNVDRLVSAALSGDSATTASIAHTLRSSSTLLGALPLADLLGRLEHSGRRSMSDLYPLALLAETEYARVSESLSEVLSGLTPQRG